MGPLGMQEMIGIFIFALVLFGPKKLPELGRTLAKALTEFRRAKNELKSTFETHLNQLEQETRLDDYTKSSSSSYTSPQYSYPYDDNGQLDSGYVSTSDTHALAAPPESNTESTASAEPVRTEAATSSESGIGQHGVPDTVPRSNGVAPVAVASEEGRPV